MRLNGCQRIWVVVAALWVGVGVWQVSVILSGMEVTAASLTAVAGDFNRQTEFDKTLDQYKKRAEQKPDDPESWYLLAAQYADKARKDLSLPRASAQRYVMLGLQMDERALTINPVYYEALLLMDTLLRQQATYENDPAGRARLIREADAVKAKAAEVLTRQRMSENTR